MHQKAALRNENNQCKSILNLSSLDEFTIIYLLEDSLHRGI